MRDARQRAPKWEQCRKCGRGARRLDAIAHAPHCPTMTAVHEMAEMPLPTSSAQTLEAKVWAWLESGPMMDIHADLDVLPCIRAAGCSLSDAIDALMADRFGPIARMFDRVLVVAGRPLRR
ncbi:MAG TPA: hypothetical protein VF761_16735 [Gemmatimonadaceae bacterium]